MYKNEHMSFEELKKELSERKLHIVAKNVGLSYPTLRKLVTGEKTNFNYNTLKKISDYLKPSLKSE